MERLRHNNHSFIQQMCQEWALNKTKKTSLPYGMTLRSRSGIKTTNERSKIFTVWRKIKQVRGMGGWSCGKRGVAIVNRVVMGGLSDGVLFEQRPEGGEGANCEAVWGKRILGSVRIKCKNPELRMFKKYNHVPYFPLIVWYQQAGDPHFVRGDCCYSPCTQKEKSQWCQCLLPKKISALVGQLRGRASLKVSVMAQA